MGAGTWEDNQQLGRDYLGASELIPTYCPISYQLKRDESTLQCHPERQRRISVPIAPDIFADAQDDKRRMLFILTAL